MRTLLIAAVCLMSLVTPTGARQAGQPRVLTAADYARAERFLPAVTTPLVYGLTVTPAWLPDGRFWYRPVTPAGSRFVMVDPSRKSQTPAFDHQKVVAFLGLNGLKAGVNSLPFTEIDFSPDMRQFTFVATNGMLAACIASTTECRVVRPAGRATGEAQAAAGRGRQTGGRQGGAGRPEGPPPEVLSPDGKRAAFIRANNLWMRDVATSGETQLTTDGVQDFGYATNNAGWTKSDAPVVAWSPDSKKIATFQHDARGVGEMYLVSTNVGHPTLQAWKYPLPGDEKIFMIERVVIDVETKKVTRLRMPPDPHRSTLCDHVVCGGTWADVQWSADNRQVAFVSTSRDHKQERLRVADASSGEVRQILEESVKTFFESGNGRVNWRYLPGSNEVIWFSERDDWGQLYLYDATTGALKNKITSGDGNVTQILRIDEKSRVIYFAGMGREPVRDPYFRHFYKIGFDGRNEVLLTPEVADHTITLAPAGEYFIDTYSTPDTPPVSVVRDGAGQIAVELQRADITKLAATGWKPPMPFMVKARDGITDLYGLMFRPTNFDPSRKYPIVNNIYPGPQSGSVGSRSFSAARGDLQAFAELGFVVVQIDGMGTPGRSKKFHEAYFGNMGDNTLPDQVAGMRQLAKLYPWIDLDRAGIYGHSGGGYAAADAMFRYPDFFKVGVSQAGNHDNRNYEDDWAEKWQGLLTTNADGTTNYDNQANQLQAKNLKGKLLLAHGTMDSNVPPYNTLLVVDALIAADKDFDLILFPNRSHGFGSEPYMIRRRWAYFVRYL